jgi:hypothetical protein
MCIQNYICSYRLLAQGALARDGPILKESIFGLFCGFLYGITSPLVGQPLDTVKTKMQAQVRHDPKNFEVNFFGSQTHSHEL